MLPPYLRRSKRLEAVRPWLSLTGISTADVSEAFASLVGPHAAGLSPTTINRLKDVWKEAFDAWQSGWHRLGRGQR
jgi:hypothetical protein